MLRDDSRRALKKLDAAQDLLTMHRMFAHAYPLFFGELRRLAQDRIRHADLADVVQQRSKLERLHLFAVQAILASQAQTVTQRLVPSGRAFRVARFERGGQRFQRRAIRTFE